VAWILLDVALALVALALLSLCALRLWRRVKDLSRTLAAAGDQVAALTAARDQVGQPPSLHASSPGHVLPAGAPLRGVRSARMP
jgi:hypothetical protein